MLNQHLQALVAERDEIMKALNYFDARIRSYSTNPDLVGEALESIEMNHRRLAELNQHIIVELELERLRRPFYKRLFTR